MDVIALVSRLLQIDAFAFVAELVTDRICMSLAAPAGHPFPAWVRHLPFSVVVEEISAWAKTPGLVFHCQESQ